MTRVYERDCGYGPETVFEALRPEFEGEATGVEIVLDHNEAQDPDWDAPLHLRAHGVLEDVDDGDGDLHDGGTGTAVLCLTEAELRQVARATLKALRTLRALKRPVSRLN